MSQQRQAVARTHSPDGGEQNQGQEVHNVRQTGLFRLGSREMCDDREEVRKGKKEKRRDEESEGGNR